MIHDIAVIFDLDGTIIDSEYNYQEADRIFLARHGVSFTEEMWQRTVGLGSEAMIRAVRRDFGLERSVEELLREKNDTYLEIARSRTRTFPEMVKLILLLKDAGVPLAVATGSSFSVVVTVLELAGLSGLFDALVSAEEVERGKPAPDIFLEAARRLGVAPGACTVIEDAQYGVEAAAGAGMSCIAVPTVLTEPLPESFSRAGLLFRSGMKAFDAERAFAWIMSQRLNASVR